MTIATNAQNVFRVTKEVDVQSPVTVKIDPSV